MRRILAAIICIAAALPAQTALAEAPAPTDALATESLEKRIDNQLGTFVGALATVLFWKIPGTSHAVADRGCTMENPTWDKQAKACTSAPNSAGLPLVVAWLFLGAVFFTLRMAFVNIRMFGHGIQVVRGRYDDPNEPGDVTHFQALAAALSATVGLGNIAGVAVAIIAGGPGAVFWMIIAAVFGMVSKFTECTLGVKYRLEDATGRVRGGPMQYLHAGFAKHGFGGLGRVLAIIFAVLCIGGSFGGGNMFQVGQAYGAVAAVLPFELSKSLFGIVMAVLVGVVIIGGITSIARVAEKIVPAMVGIYIAAALFILASHVVDIPTALGRIIGEAFSPEAGLGGLLGVFIQGVRRAAFSNEAGVGSAAIAHAAARTDEPIREGIVASLGPFIDTIIVCTMTGLVIVITGVVDDPANIEMVRSNSGAALTGVAFGSVLSWFPTVLAGCVLLFAYSTMISWSYYGERCFTYLFGDKSSIVYKLIFLLFVYFGAVSSMTNALDFSDLMVLGMSFPNIIGVVLLSGEVRADLDVYLAKLRAGAFKTFK